MDAACTIRPPFVTTPYCTPYIIIILCGTVNIYIKIFVYVFSFTAGVTKANPLTSIARNSARHTFGRIRFCLKRYYYDPKYNRTLLQYIVATLSPPTSFAHENRKLQPNVKIRSTWEPFFVEFRLYRPKKSLKCDFKVLERFETDKIELQSLKT